MISQLSLKNFRGFEAHVVPLRELTVLVGANNAGKSTIVEALRLVDLVEDRLRAARPRFVGPPEWLDDDRAVTGVRPAARGLPTDGFEVSLFHAYDDPPAVITATFASGAEVVVFVGPDAQLHGVAFDADGVAAQDRTEIAALGLVPVAVQPQVAPLLRNEVVLRSETVARGEGTYLAPQHFRNQLRLDQAHVTAFADIAADTWPGLQIRDLPSPNAPHGAPLGLNVRDGNFVGEVSLMGHGLQMWLQIVWFLARAPRDAVVILDEPDVYMHPDLQRRLLNLVRGRFTQLLIATHSLEIISDVDPQAILGVDRLQSESAFIASLPGLQDLISSLGTLQNVELMRLMRSRSFCLFEGEDRELLRAIQTVAAPEANPIDLVPGGQLGGRGGWGAGIPRRLPSRNAEGQKVRSYALLDRDYFPDAEVADRYAEARQWSVELHVWSRKELENYLLVPEAISRYIADHCADHVAPPDASLVAAEMDQYIEDVKEEVIFDGMVEVLHPRDKKGGPSKANKAVRKRMAAAWATPEGRRSIAPGKALIAHLSNWSKHRFGVQFVPEQIARSLRPDEIDAEVVEVINAVVAGRPIRLPKPGVS